MYTHTHTHTHSHTCIYIYSIIILLGYTGMIVENFLVDFFNV